MVVTAGGQDMSYLEEGYRAAGGLDQDWTQTRFVTHGRTILNINGTLLKDGCIKVLKKFIFFSSSPAQPLCGGAMKY